LPASRNEFEKIANAAGVVCDSIAGGSNVLINPSICIVGNGCLTGQCLSGTGSTTYTCGASLPEFERICPCKKGKSDEPYPGCPKPSPENAAWPGEHCDDPGDIDNREECEKAGYNYGPYKCDSIIQHLETTMGRSTWGELDSYAKWSFLANCCGVEEKGAPPCHTADCSAWAGYPCSGSWSEACPGIDFPHGSHLNDIPLSVGCPDTCQASQCWVRMPTGCDQALSETSTPLQWFVSPDSPDETTCTNRISLFNTYCNRADAAAHWGLEPEACPSVTTSAACAQCVGYAWT
jgi:hypothetical protein